MVTDDLTKAGITVSVNMVACRACTRELVFLRCKIAVAPVRGASVEDEEAIQATEVMPGNSIDTTRLSTDASAVLRQDRRRADYL
jgi:hypothetical protein